VLDERKAESAELARELRALQAGLLDQVAECAQLCTYSVEASLRPNRLEWDHLAFEQLAHSSEEVARRRWDGEVHARRGYTLAGSITAS
jgi:hypothetical protein